MTPAITSWSHSKLTEFEKCKRRVFLMHVEKVPEPQRELRPGQTEHANDRGTRIHNAAEEFVKGSGKFVAEMGKFRPDFEALQRLYTEGRVSVEGEWGMNRGWEPAPWQGEWMEVDRDDIEMTPKKVKVLPARGREGDVLQVGMLVFIWLPPWFRLKLDALVFLSDTEAVAIDYKTGRKFGNEIKHGEQLQLYQLVTFLRYPKLESITTELWYLDQDEITSVTFTRSQGLRFKPRWDSRGTALTTCSNWPANPNIHSCKWCMYGPWGSGHCAVGVQK